MPKQIGWSNESNLLYTISSQISRLAGIIATSGGGGGGGGTITGGGASGQVTFWNGATSITGSNNLFWDAAQNRLGIGTNTPQTSVDLATSAARLRFSQFVGGSIFHGIEFATTGGVYASFLGNQNTGEVRLSTNISYFPTFYASGSEGMRLTTNRNLIIQNGGTFTDDGVNRLQVGGDVKIKGSGNTNATTALTVQDSSSQNILRLRNDGFYLFGNSVNRPLFATVTGISSPNVNGTALQISIDNASARTTTGFDFLFSYGTRDYTSGNVDVHRETASYTPTSGTGTFNMLVLQNTINQTGGANGITRGLYVNPNLTTGSGAADWRSIEWSNNTGWGLYGLGTAPNYLNGNLLIGSATDDLTNRLQVTGNAKITGVAGDNLSVINSSGQNNFTIADGGSFNLGGTTTTARANISTSGFNCNLNVTNLNIANWNGSVYARFTGLDAPSGNFVLGGTTILASAKLQIDSTTQGFLPPRMTETQRNAIASPAAGLTIYNTTVNDLEVYNGSVWVNDGATVITNRQATSFTLALTDRGKLVETNVGAANTITVPPNSSITFPIGTKIDIAQYGAGQTTIVPGIGVTVRSAGGALKLSAQYSGATIVKIGTDEWYLFGDITV
jgi:hypothetical protein